MMENHPKYVSPARLVPMVSKPGVARDGTKFDDGGYHTDSLWCRWQKGRPRKMWGHKVISNNYTYPSRGVLGYTKDGVYYVNSGSPSNLETQQFNFAGIGGTFIDRTPVTLTPSANNMWQFDIMYDAVSANANLIAHAAPNLLDIDSSVQRPIFFGDAYANTPLVAIPSSSVAGGCVALYPYLFGFDADGGIIWSVVNTPGNMTGAGSGSARVTGRKIVCGRSTRGGPGINPAGLFWALDGLVRATFSGGAAVFNFDRIASEGYSILSSQGVVEADNIFYWPGQDRFLYFNGVIQEQANNTHTNFFFENLNVAYRQKVKGSYNPYWGEIQWLAPLFGATECNWMLIYNVRLGTWYDTPIDAIMSERNKVFPYPITFDNSDSNTGKTKLYIQDFGRDAIDGSSVQAIRSYYTTEIFNSLTPTLQQITNGEDVNLKLMRIIPDFRDQVGDLIITLKGQKYPQSPVDNEVTLQCPVGTDKLDPHYESKLITVQVESNTVGGDYQVGMPMMAIQKGSIRP